MKRLLPLVLLLCSTNSNAIEHDKKLHLGVSTIIGASIQYYHEDWRVTLGTCLAVGAAKEGLDALGMGDASAKDMAYNAIGCGLGILVGNTALSFTSDSDNVIVTYNIEF